MTDPKQTETPATTSGSELVRETDPNDPSHKDAGQEYVERERERLNDQEEETREEREKAEREAQAKRP